MRLEGLDPPDAARTRLRAIVTEVERGITDLQRGDRGEEWMPPMTRGLAASWADLVEQLALGEEPEVRTCPTCGRVGRRAATRCGYCWTRLSPPEDAVVS